MKVVEYLDRPERWVKSRMLFGPTVKSAEELVTVGQKNVRCSIMGAINLCYPKHDLKERLDMLGRLEKAIIDNYPKFANTRCTTGRLVSYFNEDPDTQFTDVRKILEIVRI